LALAPVVIVAGPTASGKSALALELAAAFAGTIINADSRQLYRDLPILSGSPDAAATGRVPHRLYGILGAAERASVADWRVLALAEIAAAHAARRVPILVGGTGLYLKALQHGLAAIPPIPEAIRTEAELLYHTLGGAAFRERLRALDPAAAARLPAADRYRLVRAFEVVRATGVPIGQWRSGGRSGGQSRGQSGATEAAPYRFGSILLMPPREALYANCDARLCGMIANGALAEVAALAERGLAADLPAMQAIGVGELLRHRRGEMGLAETVRLAQRATRRYAKRQMTWFRHQMTPDLLLTEKFSERLLHCSRHFIDRFLLTSQP